MIGSASGLPYYSALGAALGAALGTALGAALGTALGAALGAAAQLDPLHLYAGLALLSASLGPVWSDLV